MPIAAESLYRLQQVEDGDTLVVEIAGGAERIQLRRDRCAGGYL